MRNTTNTESMQRKLRSFSSHFSKKYIEPRNPNTLSAVDAFPLISRQCVLFRFKQKQSGPVPPSTMQACLCLLALSFDLQGVA